jgi:DNA end-binding protein Ku
MAPRPLWKGYLKLSLVSCAVARVVMLEPRGKGILATTLRYGYEVRDERGYFDEIPKVDVPDEMVDLAAHIIKTKAGMFEPAQFEDRYEDALVELIKAKQAGRAPKGPEPPTPSNVINLMDALRRSVAAGVGKRAAGARSRRRAAAPRKSAPHARKAG